MLFVVAALSFACGSASDHPHQSSTMTILVDAGERYAMFRDQSRYLLFLPLVTLEGLEVRPRLARSWEHSPDYRTWTFHLREDVRWHDGVPVTAHDIVFSLELFAHPDVLWAPGRDYDSISVPDDHTIIVHLKRPASPPPVGVPFRPWVVFFPKHLLQNLDPADFFEWDFWTRPVGNGPYRFVRRVPQTMFELEANPDFYAGEPSVQRVVLKLGGTSPLIELRSGGADVALYVTPTEALKLATDPGFVLYYGYDWSELRAIYWNQRHPLLADAAVRRALSHAIDRRALARSLSYPEEMPLAGGVSNEDLKDDPYRYGGWDQGPAYDPGLAERRLQQAGWIDRDGNGVRERAGREARFTLVVNTAGDGPGLEPGILVQDQLRRVGVAVEIRPMELSATLDDLRRGDFEAMIHYVDNTPDGILVDWLGEPHPGGVVRRSGERSPFGYRSPEAARLLRVLYRERDLDAQDTLYHRINEIFRRDMPVTFLFPSVYVNAAHRRIRGIRRGWGWALLQVPEELWIENEP